MMVQWCCGAIVLLWAGCVAASDVEVYGIDNTHSFANWTIRHVVSKTSGTFPDIKGKITIDRQNLSNSSVEASINVVSVNSSHARRDANIRQKDYLDALKFAEMKFVSTKVEAQSQDEGILTGNLTLHGVTRQISFPFKVLGYGMDPWGGKRLGLEAHTAIKSSDYGFGWSIKPKAAIGDDTEITLLIKGVKNSPDFKPW